MTSGPVTRKKTGSRAVTPNTIHVKGAHSVRLFSEGDESIAIEGAQPILAMSLLTTYVWTT